MWTALLVDRRLKGETKSSIIQSSPIKSDFLCFSLIIARALWFLVFSNLILLTDSLTSFLCLSTSFWRKCRKVVSLKFIFLHFSAMKQKILTSHAMSHKYRPSDWLKSSLPFQTASSFSASACPYKARLSLGARRKVECTGKSFTIARIYKIIPLNTEQVSASSSKDRFSCFMLQSHPVLIN